MFQFVNDWCLLCICGSEIRCVFCRRHPCVAGMCGNMRCPPQIWPPDPYLPVNTRPASSSSPPSLYFPMFRNHLPRSTPPQFFWPKIFQRLTVKGRKASH